jgi:hypothetical protein
VVAKVNDPFHTDALASELAGQRFQSRFGPSLIPERGSWSTGTETAPGPRVNQDANDYPAGSLVR